MVRRAVIDIGTNSVKVLVAEITGIDIRPLVEESEQTRLGRGFYESRRLQPDAIAATVQAVARFADLARSWQATQPRVIATSAARDALNAAELTGAITAATGLAVEIISGEQEAAWVFDGIASDPRLAGPPLLIVDVGGGSTEFVLGRKDEQFFRQSFPLGTVRLMEKLPVSDPPQPRELALLRTWVRGFLAQAVAPHLTPALKRLAGTGVQLVGTGGTPVIMARIQLGMQTHDREQIDSLALHLGHVRGQVEHLWAQPLADRRAIPGLPPSRADVILMGAVIFESIMDQFGFPNLRPSTRGLRYAALLAETP